MLTTSNNESIHNTLKNQRYIRYVPTLIQLFIKRQQYFTSKCRPSIERRSASKLAYRLYLEMSTRQKVVFCKELQEYDKPHIKNIVEAMKGKGVTINSNMCGCTVRAKYCVPCVHMLYELEQECSNIVQQKENLINDIEKEFASDVSIGEEEEEEDMLLDGLDEQALEQKQSQERSIEFTRKVKELFETKLRSNLVYETIVIR